MMPRRFALVSLALTAAVAYFIGGVSSRGADAPAADVRIDTPRPAAAPAGVPGPLVNFADVVERINGAVVNIDATSRGGGRRRTLRSGEVPDPPEPGTPRPDRDAPRRGTGSGFIIDADGSIITNHHVIDRAERITVKLSDGRTLRARVIGTDPDTDIALIKVDGQSRLPVAPLGDSSQLRMGEW